MANSQTNVKAIAQCLVFLGLTGCLPAMADPVVLSDQGPTRPVQDYGIPDVPVPSPQRMPAMAAGAAALAPSFPVKTPGLTVGEVAPTAVNLPQLADRPIFMVGSDEASRSWLARHQSRLTQINAIGILVQADHRPSQSVRAAVRGLVRVADPGHGRQLQKVPVDGDSHGTARVAFRAFDLDG